MSSENATTLGVDDLAQEIRRIDGNHDLGAGALAEALMPFLVLRSKPVASGVDGGDIDALEDRLAEAEGLLRLLHDKAPTIGDSSHFRQALNMASLFLSRSALLPKATAPVVSEPVAWRWKHPLWPDKHWQYGTHDPRIGTDDGVDPQPLYASPAPQAVITEERVERFCIDRFGAEVWTNEWSESRRMIERRQTWHALEAAMKEA